LIKVAQAEQEIQEGKLLDGPSTLSALREKVENPYKSPKNPAKPRKND